MTWSLKKKVKSSTNLVYIVFFIYYHIMIKITRYDISFDINQAFGGLLNFPAKRIAFNILSRTKNKNGLLILISFGALTAALKPTSSIEDAAAPTVPSLVTSTGKRKQSFIV